MSLDWAARPEDAKVVEVGVKQYTPDGLPCQVEAVVEFFDMDSGGPVSLGKRPVTISPGWVSATFPGLSPEQAKAKFEQFFNTIPNVPQAVLDDLSDLIPKKGYRAIWSPTEA